MEENFVRLIAQISAYIIILPFLLALLRIRGGNREQKLLSLLIFSSLFFEFAALAVGQAGLRLNNLFLLHIFTVIEFAFLVLIFRPHLHPVISRPAGNGIIAAFTVFAIINSIFFEPLTQFNAFGRAIEAVVVIFLVLLCFSLLLRSLKIRQPAQSPLIWISIGTLIYFSGSLFVFIFSNYVLSSPKMSVTIWGIHAFISIVLKLFYTIALWVRPKE
ncbi:MAG: hypothetical protein AAGG75_11290 [Bacteroidota bacterium]